LDNAGFVTNSATVTTASNDPNPDNNTASVLSSVVAPSSDLALGLAAAPNPVFTGANLTYSLTVSNLGPATATAVSLTNTLPPGVNFVSASPAAYTVSGRVITFTNLGAVQAGSYATATIVARPTALGTITDSATCASAMFDPTKANNVANVKTVVESAQLTVNHVGSQFIMSWTADAVNYRLQSADSLTQTNWLDVTNPAPQIINGQFTISLGTTNARKFFRLIAPQ